MHGVRPFRTLIVKTIFFNSYCVFGILVLKYHFASNILMADGETASYLLPV